MQKVYIISTTPHSGKTAIAVAIALHLQQAGKKVAWFKPVSSTVTAEDDNLIDLDAQFVKEALGLEASAADLSPFALTPETLREILESGEQPGLRQQMIAALERVAGDADIVLIEGGQQLREGSVLGIAVPDVAAALDAPTLAVSMYDDLDVMDGFIGARTVLGERLMGCVINHVPHSRMHYVETTIRTSLETRQIPVLAIIPRQQMLAAVTVGELAELLQGEVLTAHNQLDQMVENLSVGAMSADTALSYFRRNPNKAVITGGDRPDLHLAALETSTRALILTGNLRPTATIISRAEELGVPIILAPYDTLATIEIVEQFFGKVRFHQPAKVRLFMGLIEERFDWQRFYELLGLTQ